MSHQHIYKELRVLRSSVSKKRKVNIINWQREVSLLPHSNQVVITPKGYALYTGCFMVKELPDI